MNNMAAASTADRKVALRNGIKEISNAMLQIESQREHMKEVVKNLSEEYEIDKAVINQLAKIYHKQNASEVQAKAETIIEEYEALFG